MAVTAGNFLRTVPAALLLLTLIPGHPIPAVEGILYAALSGALASGAGYAIWYAALRNLNATTAAAVQLSVPVLAAAGGVLLLGEAITLRLLPASAAILGGIALFIATKR
jgi:drug/metabolite transporter (DMT)-like permease